MTPSQLPKRCGYSGCKEFVGHGVKYCQAHQRKKYHEADMIRGGGDPFYKTSQWYKIRNHVIQSHPICKVCQVAIATHVDHIKPRSAGGADYDLANLQPICARCHAQKTAKENKIT